MPDDLWPHTVDRVQQSIRGLPDRFNKFHISKLFGGTKPSDTPDKCDTLNVLSEEYNALFGQRSGSSGPATQPAYDDQDCLAREINKLLDQAAQRLATPSHSHADNEYRLSQDHIDAVRRTWATLAAEASPAMATAAPTATEPLDLSLHPAAAINQQGAVALCLSGGGIRSAAFSLGVLQALARHELLTKIHYLSTVSGGGYIGAWLTNLMRRFGGSAVLTQFVLAIVPSSEPVANIREFTNFLAPSAGYVSADARTAALLVLRNIVLNWLLFLPALLALSLVPVFAYQLVATVADLPPSILPDDWVLLPLALPAIFLCVAAMNTCRWLPSHDNSSGTKPGRPTGESDRTVLLWITLWVLTWGLLFSAWCSFTLAHRAPFHAILIGCASALPPMWLAYRVAWHREKDDTGRQYFEQHQWLWVAACLIDVGLLWLGVYLTSRYVAQVDLRTALIAIFGPLWVVASHTIQAAIYVGLRQGALKPDLDREWIARLNANSLGMALGWSAFSGVVLFGPGLLEYLPLSGLVGLGGSGVLAAALGFSARTLFLRQTPAELKGFRVRWDMVMLAATFVFGVLLFATFGELAKLLCSAVGNAEDWLATWLAATPQVAVEPAQWPCSCDLMVDNTMGLIPSTPYAWQRMLAAGVLAIILWYGAWRLGSRMSINRFSLHDLYRNRLARAFPGSARFSAERTPDQFTGFDPNDNPRMAELFRPTSEPRALFPVINVTLNLVAPRQSRRNSWNERKAAPFIITPLRCGAQFLDLPDPTSPRFGYVRTSGYAGNEVEDKADKAAKPAGKSTDSGISLGTAMTISGAALSPNMGYHSSPPAALLMTLFNVRLGVWLPNPRTVKYRPQANLIKPPNALGALMNEMLGMTDADADSIYLSDGGHFDNLGIYEMLRRQCRYIIVMDAGADPDYAYADLGATLRRAAIDMDVRIDFVHPTIAGDKHLRRSARLAHITYKDGRVGELLYVKPYLPVDAPADVTSYAASHASFPHETTANQFFTESQFESYRHLGSFLMRKVIGNATTIPGIFATHA